ncbi:RBR-type E3 ubiquitin transferase [Sporobolomyces koalae]|uniref:RBR-type E3 ubiquitin transferase n=1 Tax=Sporobolomyces koalae TaxID=500713 RepID=UPI00317D5C44
MLNDRLEDELLAFESILPDAVTSRTERPDGTLVLVITVKVDFDQPQVVICTDAVPLAPAPAATRPDSTRSGPIVPPSPSARTSPTVIQSRSSKSKRGRGTRSASPSVATNSPHTSPRDRSAPARPRLADGPCPSTPTAIPLSHSKTPRISIVPRPRTPPPPTLDLAPSLDNLSLTDVPNRVKHLELRYLPPLTLSIELPPEYPHQAGPAQIVLSSKHDWLSPERCRYAENRLNSVYDGDECLFSIVELVSSTSSDFFSTLSLKDPIVIEQERPSLQNPHPALLSDLLVAYDRASASDAFDNHSHECPLCFSPRKGTNCVRIESCGCTFCKPCLRDYFDLLITEGMVRTVACPAIECVTLRSKWEKTNGGKLDEEFERDKPGRVTAKEVESLCGPESSKRFEWLREKYRVESDPSISFCPRETCQAATPKLDEDKLRVCVACNFAYCVFCRKGWHGTRNPCSLPQSNQIVTQYLAATELERKTLEQRYGSANLKRLVQAFEEEKALQEWLDQHSTRCPGCSIPIEKSAGCNHMTCGKCGSHLCYRCGKSISPTEPYKHFNTPTSSCYGKLFDFLPGQEPPVEEWLGELIAQD